MVNIETYSKGKNYKKEMAINTFLITTFKKDFISKYLVPNICNSNTNQLQLMV